jgi:hypothetical protein
VDVNWPSDGGTPGSAIGTGPVFFAATSTAAAFLSATFFAAPELHVATLANDNHFTGAAFQIAVAPAIYLPCPVTIEKHLDAQFWDERRWVLAAEAFPLFAWHPDNVGNPDAE